jgi:hypothetical protein
MKTTMLFFLTKETRERLRRLATVEGVSMGELVRRAIDAYLKREVKKGGRQ